MQVKYNKRLLKKCRFCGKRLNAKNVKDRLASEYKMLYNESTVAAAGALSFGGKQVGFFAEIAR